MNSNYIRNFNCQLPDSFFFFFFTSSVGHQRQQVYSRQLKLYQKLCQLPDFFSFPVGDKWQQVYNRQLKLCKKLYQIIKKLLLPPTFLTPAQIKPKSFESRWNFSSSVLFNPERTRFMLTPGADASHHVYVRVWTLCCFYNVYTRTFRRALTASVDSCAEIECLPPQWRNQFWQSLEEGAGK